MTEGDEPRVESGHDPAQDVDLPVAASLFACFNCGHIDVTRHFPESEEQSFMCRNCEEAGTHTKTSELVKKSDTEEAIKEARKQAELHTLLQDQYRTEQAREERIEELREDLDSEE